MKIIFNTTLLPVFFALVILAVLIAPSLSSSDPGLSMVEYSLAVPGAAGFLLGADSNGRDLFALILHGARQSLLISLAVVSLTAIAGTLAGFVAGYNGGIFDRAFIIIGDVFQAFPGILLAIGLAAFLTPGVGNLILLLSFVGWVGYARVVRAQVIEMKSREFITAAKALGIPLAGQLTRHFLPNMLGPLIVQASFGMAGVMMAESTLSFLGLGLPDHVPSLGKLMDQGVGLLLVAPHVALFPGLVIMLFVLLFNLMGDWLRARWA